MKKHTDAVNKCVTQGYVAKPPLKGTVQVGFTIRTSGSVGEVHMTFGKRRHASTGACLRTEVRRWKFNKNREEPTVVAFTLGSRR